MDQEDVQVTVFDVAHSTVLSGYRGKCFIRVVPASEDIVITLPATFGKLCFIKGTDSTYKASLVGAANGESNLPDLIDIGDSIIFEQSGVTTYSENKNTTIP